jgi:hypothetical protein
MLQNDDPPSGDTNKTCCRGLRQITLTTFGTLFGSPLYYSLTSSFFDFQFVVLWPFSGSPSTLVRTYITPGGAGSGSRAAAFEPQQYPDRRQTLYGLTKCQRHTFRRQQYSRWCSIHPCRRLRRHLQDMRMLQLLFFVTIGSATEQEKQYSKTRLAGWNMIAGARRALSGDNTSG